MAGNQTVPYYGTKLFCKRVSVSSWLQIGWTIWSVGTLLDHDKERLELYFAFNYPRFIWYKLNITKRNLSLYFNKTLSLKQKRLFSNAVDWHWGQSDDGWKRRAYFDSVKFLGKLLSNCLIFFEMGFSFRYFLWTELSMCFAVFFTSPLFSAGVVAFFFTGHPWEASWMWESCHSRPLDAHWTIL